MTRKEPVPDRLPVFYAFVNPETLRFFQWVLESWLTPSVSVCPSGLVGTWSNRLRHVVVG